MTIITANNNSLSEITTLPSSIIGGAMTLISEQTASGSATISFTSGIDSTYDSYVFKFINIHPATDDVNLQFNLSTDSGSNYNVTKTTTVFRAIHAENGSLGQLQYESTLDLAQSTSDQMISLQIGNNSDASSSGSLTLYNPSSDTFVKNFVSRSSTDLSNVQVMQDFYVAGYGNTTSAVNAIIFRMSSGNIDSGVIKLYGIS